MKKVFKINYHSFVDIITNSSSEMFISTDKKVIEFFKEIFKEDVKTEGSYIKLMTGKEYKKHYYYDNDDQPSEEIKDDDELLYCNIDSESYGFIDEIMDVLRFKRI